MKVFLADDHPLLRMALRLSLERETDIEVVGEAGDGFSAVQRIQEVHPDVSLIDVDMPGLSGIGTIRVLRQVLPEMKILVLSTYNNEDYIRGAMQAGADGYVLKNVGADELLRIIRGLDAGEAVVSAYLINLAMLRANEQETSDRPRAPLLTQREKEVLKAIAGGKSNKEISLALNISTETVKSHIKSIYEKLNVKNRVEASQLAVQLHLLG